MSKKEKEVAAIDMAPDKPKFKEIDGLKIPIRMTRKDLGTKPYLKTYSLFLNH